MPTQVERYECFYGKHDRFRWLFRFDVRYRCRRLAEVLRQIGFDPDGARILDFGFGHGDLLTVFPSSAKVYGVDVSPSAVSAAESDARFRRFAEAKFAVVPERDFTAIFPEKFEVVLSSHALEHVCDDASLLAQLHARVADHGLLVLFVPIEEPDYIRFHLRNYSQQSIQERVMNAGFEIVHFEGSMQINGHIWKVLTIPSRRSWPVLGPCSDALRLFTLSLIPYPAVKFLDRLLDALGFGPRQALVVARKQRVSCSAQHKSRRP